MSTRLVAARTMIPSFAPNPSISTRSWFRVCSRSSCPPPSPVPLCLATASISSINTIHGAFFFACAKRSLTLAAPTPTNISTKSDPEILKNGTPASPAMAFAMSVLPVPGGPTRRTPFGIRAPTLTNLPGFLRKHTISSRSSFSSLRPATSSNVIFFFLLFFLSSLSFSSGSVIFALLLPKFIIWPPPPCDDLTNSSMTKNITIMTRTYGIITLHMLVFSTSFRLHLATTFLSSSELKLALYLSTLA